MDRVIIPVSREVREYLRRLSSSFDNCSFDSLLRILLVDHEIAAKSMLKDTTPGSEAYDIASDSLLGIDESFKVERRGVGGRPKGAKDSKPRTRRKRIPGIDDPVIKSPGDKGYIKVY